MLTSAIVRTSDICTRHPWCVIALALALSAFSAAYTERHFAIKTDVNELISPDLPWDDAMSYPSRCEKPWGQVTA